MTTKKTTRRPRAVGPSVTGVPQVSCLKCAYWHPDDDYAKGHGECRRRQPVVDFDRRGQVECAWPRTGADDWCGEFDEQLGLWRALS